MFGALFAGANRILQPLLVLQSMLSGSVDCERSKKESVDGKHSRERICGLRVLERQILWLVARVPKAELKQS